MVRSKKTSETKKDKRGNFTRDDLKNLKEEGYLYNSTDEKKSGKLKLSAAKIYLSKPEHENYVYYISDSVRCVGKLDDIKGHVLSKTSNKLDVNKNHYFTKNQLMEALSDDDYDGNNLALREYFRAVDEKKSRVTEKKSIIISSQELLNLIEKYNEKKEGSEIYKIKGEGIFKADFDVSDRIGIREGLKDKIPAGTLLNKLFNAGSSVISVNDKSTFPININDNVTGITKKPKPSSSTFRMPSMMFKLMAKQWSVFSKAWDRLEDEIKHYITDDPTREQFLKEINDVRRTTKSSDFDGKSKAVGDVESKQILSSQILKTSVKETGVTKKKIRLATKPSSARSVSPRSVRPSPPREEEEEEEIVGATDEDSEEDSDNE